MGQMDKPCLGRHSVEKGRGKRRPVTTALYSAAIRCSVKEGAGIKKDAPLAFMTAS